MISPAKVKVLVSIPNEGITLVESYTNRLENFFHLGKLQQGGSSEFRMTQFEFHFLTLGRIFTPLAREEAAKAAIEIEADYLYMIDDDMMCPNDMFERLYKHDVDLVAPLAFTRNFPHHAVLYDAVDEYDPTTKSYVFFTNFIDKYPKDKLVECDAVGFGAVLIKSKVLQAIPRPRFMSTCGTGEDVYFCNLTKKAGFRVFMDTSLKLGHLSHPIEVNEEYVNKVRKEFKYSDSLSLSPKRMENKPGESVLIRG